MELWYPRGNRWPLWPWLAVISIGLVDALWIAFSPISITQGSLFLICLLCMSAAIFAYAADRFRYSSYVYVMGSGVAFLMLAWPVLRFFNHLTMTIPMPWADNMLSQADRSLGLDWNAYIDWIEANPRYFYAVEWTYSGLDRYSALFYFLIAFCSDRRERCFEFLALLIISASLCMIIGLFFPAKAAVLHYLPDLSQYKNILPSMGANHIEYLQTLRMETAPILRIDDLPGLVTFPSFHTALGLILIYVCRTSPWLLGVSLTVNLSMIATTPLLGSHYFIDLIGGALMALVSIVIVRKLNGFGRRTVASQSSPVAYDVPSLT